MASTPRLRPLPRRGRRTACFSRFAVAIALAVTGFLGDSAEAVAAPARKDDAEIERHGPLRIAAPARRRVRGGRPENAGINVAWAAPAERPDRANEEALAAFERAAFPEGVPMTVAQTIVEEPPEAWMKALAKPEIPIRWNRRTVEYLRFFRDDPKGKNMMKAWMRRAAPLLPRLREILREVGVPEDLVMVALAESGFNPRVRSRVGAAGLWQFMDGTGSVYGLHQDYWIDERLDIERSTRAAALYLADLRVRFGSWELALAAYNAGYGIVMASIDRHNTNNYWALCEIESGLPYATTNYVPKILAAAIVGRNLEAFGIDEKSLPPPLSWVEVKVQRSTSIAALAKALDVDEEVLRILNAHLIRDRTPPGRGEFVVRIPRNKLDAFKASRPRLQAAWDAEGTHLVRHGETLQAIAAAHGIDEKALRRMNGVRDAAEVPGGITLVVPGGHKADPEPTTDEPRLLAAVPPLRPGPRQRLVFYANTPATTPRTLEEATGIPWERIVAWNDLDPHARLQAGQVLQLLVDERFDPASRNLRVHEVDEVELVARGSREHLEASLARRGMLRRGYRVRAGDTLAKIGRRFDLTLGDLARINGFSRDHEPAVDDVLVVYVPEPKIRGTVEAPAPRGFEEPVARAGREPSTAETARVPGKGSRPAQRRPSTAETSRVPGRGSP